MFGSNIRAHSFNFVVSKVGICIPDPHEGLRWLSHHLKCVKYFKPDGSFIL